MVFVSTTVRITRFAQDLPISGLGGEIGPGIGLPGVSPLLPNGGINIGIPGGGFPGYPGFPGPFGGPIPPGGPIPVPPGVSPTAHILNISIPKPVNPGMSVNILMWFASAFAPATYAMHLTIPAINYDHITPFVPGNGPGVLLLQNQFQVPTDAAPGNLQGNIQLVRTDPQTSSQITDDQEPFTLDVELTPTNPDGCPTGATKDGTGVCHCTDPTKEIVGSSCVPKCASGQHRDSTGNCVPDSITCPAGQHLDTASNTCVPDVVTPTPCPTGQHRDTAGHCVPDVVTPPPPSTDCFTFQGVQYCKSATPGQGCVRINNLWYCPPGAGTPIPHPGGGRHRRQCFRHNGIRYCKVTTPPADVSHCITVQGGVWCPRPPGTDSHPGGDHGHNCLPGQRYNWCIHGCVPASSTIADCPPDDDDHDHDGHGDDDDDHDGHDHDHDGHPGTSIPGGAGAPGIPGLPGTTSGGIPAAQAQQIEISLRNMAEGWRQRGANSQQIQTYINNLRNQIYARVQQQLAAAGIHQ